MGAYTFTHFTKQTIIRRSIMQTKITKPLPCSFNQISRSQREIEKKQQVLRTLQRISNELNIRAQHKEP